MRIEIAPIKTLGGENSLSPIAPTTIWNWPSKLAKYVFQASLIRRFFPANGGFKTRNPFATIFFHLASKELSASLARSIMGILAQIGTSVIDQRPVWWSLSQNNVRAVNGKNT